MPAVRRVHVEEAEEEERAPRSARERGCVREMFVVISESVRESSIPHGASGVCQ